MSITSAVIGALAKPVSAWILKRFISDFAGDVGGDLVKELVKYGLTRDEAKKTVATANEVARGIVENIGRSIAKDGRPDVNQEAVALGLARAFGESLKTGELVADDLNEEAVFQSLRRSHPAKPAEFSAAESALYERGLLATARALVEAAPKLPDYLRTRDQAVLGRLTKVAAGVATLDRRVRAMDVDLDMVAKYMVKGPLSKKEQFATEYRRQVTEALDELDLFGVDLPKESRKYKLSVAYISLNLESGAGESQSGPQQAGTVLDNLTGLRLLIRGEAGCGKTTLLKWAAIRCCKPIGSVGFSAEAFATIAEKPLSRSAISESLKEATRVNLSRFFAATLYEDTGSDRVLARATASPWFRRIPFYIRLRDCTGGKLPPVEEFARRTASLHGSVPAGWEEEILTAGDAMVLLDGIDEVPPKHRMALHKQVQRLIQQFPECLYVMTTRPLSEGEPDWLEEMQFQEARVAPMSAVDRDRCIDKWHEAVTEELERYKRTDARLPKLPGQLKAALRDAPEIARLATNPLLCAMICALHRSKNHLPENLNELMEALSTTLLYSREQETPEFDLKEFDAAYSGLSYSQRKAIVSHLAKYMIEEGASALPRNLAKKKIAEALAHTKDRSPADADIVLRGLIERSGMLRDKTPDTVDFIHNTFKEYLAATRFQERDNVAAFVKNVGDPAWENVAVFAAASAVTKPEYSENLITKLLPSPQAKRSRGARAPRGRGKGAVVSPGDAVQYRRSVMAMRVYAAIGTSVGDETKRRLKELQKTLFPPRSLTAAAGLATAGNAVLKFVSFNSKLTAAQRVRCIRTLRLVGTPEAEERLLQFREDRTLEVIEELVQAIDPLLIPAVVECFAETAETYAGRASPTEQELGWRDGVRQAAGRQIRSCKCLMGRSDIIELDFSYTGVTDAGLADLAAPTSALKSLKSLDLRGTGVTDAGVATLAAPTSALKTLTSLSLSGAGVTDAALATLAAPTSALKTLTSLDLRGAGVTDAGLAALAAPTSALKTLTSLNLLGTDVTDAGVAALAAPTSALKTLTSLNLLGTDVTDAGVAALAAPTSALESLTSLSLSGMGVTDAGVAALAAPTSALESLTSLSLSGASVTDAGVAALAAPTSALKSLTSLDLSGTDVTDVGVAALAAPTSALKSLTSLNLFGADVTDAGVAALAAPTSALKSLTSLDLGGNSVTNASLRALVAPETALKSLRKVLLFETRVTDDAVREMARADLEITILE